MAGRTAIETLGRARPVLRQRVDDALGQCKTLRGIRDMLASEYGVRLSHQAINNYRRKRLAALEPAQRRQRQDRALREIAEEHPELRDSVEWLTRVLEIESGQCR